MISRAFIIPIALTAIAVGALYLLAVEFYLYWMFLWFDIVVHFFGGALVALTTFWFLFIARVIPRVPATMNAFMASALVITLSIGIAWEIFEYSINAFPATHYLLDTAIDLIADVVGALTAMLYVRHSRFSVVVQ
jgi:hypothetical protein